MVAHSVKGSIVNVASILDPQVASSVAPYAIESGVVQMNTALASNERATVFVSTRLLRAISKPN